MHLTERDDDSSTFCAPPHSFPRSPAGGWMGRNGLLFALMCAIWGTTWLAIKVGVTAVPPLLFAASRFLLAGTLMLVWMGLAARCAGRRPPRVPSREWAVLLAVSLLVITGTYALLFWGMRHVDSGLGAILNLGLMPVALLGIGLLYGEERFRPGQAVAIALGLAGLALLLGPALALPGDSRALWGALAVVGGTLSYCWGTVLGRRLLRRHPPLLLSGLQTLLGGCALALLTVALEGPALRASGGAGATLLRAALSPAVLGSWLFLVAGGSLVAFTIYLYLVREWGPLRAGLYAFISPVVALALGSIVFGEPLTTAKLAGSALVLAAAWLALRPADPEQEP